MTESDHVAARQRLALAVVLAALTFVISFGEALVTGSPVSRLVAVASAMITLAACWRYWRVAVQEAP